VSIQKQDILFKLGECDPDFSGIDMVNILSFFQDIAEDSRHAKKGRTAQGEGSH